MEELRGQKPVQLPPTQHGADGNPLLCAMELRHEIDRARCIGREQQEGGKEPGGPKTEPTPVGFMLKIGGEI